MKKPFTILLWLLLGLAGAFAFVTLALHRGEHISSAYLLLAALCTCAIGYRFYSNWIVFGYHFAAISGPGLPAA